MATITDLTTTSGTVNNVVFVNTTQDPTGTGVIQPFLGIQNSPIETGYNTDGSTPLDDKNTASIHTGSVQLFKFTLVNADGTPYDGLHGPAYREILLDIGQSGNNNSPSTHISLDEFQIYIAGVGNLLDTTNALPSTTNGLIDGGATFVYDLDSGGDVSVTLSDHSTGNGGLDYRILVPDSLFANAGATDTSYVYVYAAFSGANGSFEEFATGQGSPTPPPGHTGAIDGFKFQDLDGSLTTTEFTAHGLEGWTIVLEDSNHNQIATAQTDANGQYHFGSLADGVYYVHEVQQSGWTELTNADYLQTYTLNIIGGSALEADFVNFKNFSISGTKYTDVNGLDNNSAIGDDDQAGTPGQTFTINLYKWVDTGDNIVQDGELTQLNTTETNATTGAWSFGDLGPLAAGEKYYVKEIGESGWSQTFGTNGYVITPNGTDSTSNNFANFKQFTISGTKYTDVNGLDNNSAIGDDDQAGTPGQTFTINLYKWVDTGDNIVQAGELTQLNTTETNETTGAWSFGNLGPLAAGEKYYVKEIGESGWTQTFGTDGYVITPTSGTDSTSNNFANFKQFTISGIKYTDVNGLDNNSAIGDDDQAGTPGQTFTINLYKWVDTGDNIVQAGELTQLNTTETNETTGAWSFGNLGPLAAGEKYYVKEIGESGWTQTFGTNGYVITPTSGTDSTNNNFANFELFDISGTKYLDKTGDGITADDGRLANVKIFIDLNNNGSFNWTDGNGNGVWDPGEGDRWTVTDANGNYSFTGLDYTYAGDKVYEVLPNGYVQTAGNGGLAIVGTSGHDQTDLNFANFLFKPAYALTQGYWGSHLQAWDGAPGLGKTTSTSDVPKDANPSSTYLLLGDLNHDGVATGTEVGHTLQIDLSLAQSIESAATQGDARLIMLQQAIATQLNIYNDYNKYLVDNIEPHNVIWEAVDWLKATGGILADGVLSASDTTTVKGKIVLGAGSQTWGADQTFFPTEGGSVTHINGEDIKNALMWFNQGQLVVSQDGNGVAWKDGAVLEDFHQNQADNFWLTLHSQGLV